jgi:hypothetical protein
MIGGQGFVGVVFGVGRPVRLERGRDIGLREFVRHGLRRQEQALHEFRGVFARLQRRLPGARGGKPVAAAERGGARQAEAADEEATTIEDFASHGASLRAD